MEAALTALCARTRACESFSLRAWPRTRSRFLVKPQRRCRRRWLSCRGLFEMVKLFEMVSWPENAILVLILRSAHVQKVPQARTCVARVSKDEDGDGVGALMLRDASQRSEAAEAAVLASRCDAPLHEGGCRPGRWFPRLRSKRGPCLRVLLRRHRIITRRSHAARLHLGCTFGFDCRNRHEAL